MPNRTSTTFSFCRYFKGIQTDSVTVKISESGYKPGGSVRDAGVREIVETEGIETTAAGRANAQALTQWFGEIQPNDGQRAIAADPGMTAVYLRVGYKDEPDDVYWYARVTSGAVIPRAYHFDRGDFNGRASYTIEFERASAFQRASGVIVNLAHIGSPPPSEYGLGLDMTNSGSGCTATLATPSTNAGDSAGFVELTVWNRTSNKSIGRVFIGGQQSASVSPQAMTWGDTSCPGNRVTTLIASGTIDLSAFVTGDVRPILRTNATGATNARWAASDMEFSLDDGATWAPFEYGHAIASRGRVMRLPVSRLGALPGVNPTITLKVRNYGTTTRTLMAGELYLFPCDLWAELYCATPPGYNQAVVVGGYRGDIAAQALGLVSGGDAIVANMDAYGNPSALIPDSVNRVGKPVSMLPAKSYSLCALVEMSDGSAAAASAFKLKAAYVARRRSI